MNKRTNPTNSKTNQSFSDFTSTLSAKWRLLTTPAKPALPGKDQHGPEEMEDILRQLVGIPTTTGNYEANHNALDYIERFLKKRGLYVTRPEWNGIESLVATTGKSKTPTVFLAAHLDVVPGSEEMFELREEDGKYFGRGTLDMKFAIAAYLQIVDDLKGKLQQYDFGIVITTDEEAGGFDGMGNLVEDGYLPKVCVLPDGGDDWQIQTFSKGFYYLSLTVDGSPAHGSRPWLGDNAILRIAKVINEMHELFPEINVDTNSFNIGRIHGGQTVNQVAHHAEALLDIRYISKEEGEKVLAKIKQICRSYDAKLHTVIKGLDTNFDLEDPLIAPFAQLITEVTGTKVVGSRTTGSNDTRYFAEYGIPCISVYPKGGGHHGPNEWLDKESFFQFHTIVRKYIDQVARKNTRSAAKHPKKNSTVEVR